MSNRQGINALIQGNDLVTMNVLVEHYFRDLALLKGIEVEKVEQLTDDSFVLHYSYNPEHPLKMLDADFSPTWEDLKK